MIQKGSFKAHLELHSKSKNTGHEAITFTHTHERSATHSEFMTHRVSRNASSARAIPRKRMDKWTQQDPALPLHLGRNQSGMQSGSEVDDKDIVIKKMLKFYQISRKFANHLYEEHDLHKEICNRFDETFAWINVVSTWSRPAFMNYVGLRCTKYAEPRIQRLAINMLREYKASEPQLLNPGDWHVPFISDFYTVAKNGPINTSWITQGDINKLLVWSTARSAWVSYRTVEEKDATWELAKKRHDDCTSLKHCTPLEHQKRCTGDGTSNGGTTPGFDEYRHMIPDESIKELDIDAILAEYEGVDYLTA